MSQKPMGLITAAAKVSCVVLLGIGVVLICILASFTSPMGIFEIGDLVTGVCELLAQLTGDNVDPTGSESDVK